MKKSTRVWLSGLTAGVLQVVVDLSIHNHVLRALAGGVAVGGTVFVIGRIGKR